MSNENVDLYLENQTLKNEFVARGLDLSQVFCPSPDNLERENRVLLHLLDWVDKYMVYRSRDDMEAAGYHFPPIDPDISPEDDWHRFTRWLQGKPLQQRLRDGLPPSYTPILAVHLTDDELIDELEKLITLLAEIRVSVNLVEDVPARLVYEHLLETLDEEFDILTAGWWHLDGCTGYCPGCFQRPWCKTGSASCWPEDEQAGQMSLIELLKKYVSASPTSLRVLQKLQAEEDRELAQDRNGRAQQGDSQPLDLDEGDLPF